MPEEKTRTAEVKDDTKDLVDHVTHFLETYYQYISIIAAQKIIKFASATINSFVVAFLCVLVVAFIGFGLAWWIGDMVNSRAGGFFIVAGIYALILVVLIVMRKKVLSPFLRNLITRKIYE